MITNDSSNKQYSIFILLMLLMTLDWLSEKLQWKATEIKMKEILLKNRYRFIGWYLNDKNI